MAKKKEKSPTESLDECPECGMSWVGKDIYEAFAEMREKGEQPYSTMTDQQLEAAAGQYGWTPENPKHFRLLLGIELSYGDHKRYDGVSYWRCPGCKATWNRFTGNKLEGEIPER